MYGLHCIVRAIQMFVTFTFVEYSNVLYLSLTIPTLLSRQGLWHLTPGRLTPPRLMPTWLMPGHLTPKRLTPAHLTFTRLMPTCLTAVCLTPIHLTPKDWHPSIWRPGIWHPCVWCMHVWRMHVCHPHVWCPCNCSCQETARNPLLLSFAGWRYVKGSWPLWSNIAVEDFLQKASIFFCPWKL